MHAQSRGTDRKGRVSLLQPVPAWDLLATPAPFPARHKKRLPGQEPRISGLSQTR